MYARMYQYVYLCMYVCKRSGSSRCRRARSGSGTCRQIGGGKDGETGRQVLVLVCVCVASYSYLYSTLQHPFLLTLLDTFRRTFTDLSAEVWAERGCMCVMKEVACVSLSGSACVMK